jgi:ectoine hydroxylase-related dioxygenase (phytanoyl-CoA dioxygenase family)
MLACKVDNKLTSYENVIGQSDVPFVQKNLKENGYFIFREQVDQNVIDELKLSIDSLAATTDTEQNYGGSEHRIWKAHEKSPLIKEFCDFSDEVVSLVESIRCNAFDILAIRNQSLGKDASALSKGRWHIDSFRRQIKIFLFLSDVTMTSGAFEMIPGTHANSFKIKQAFRGRFFTPKDLIEGTRAYSKFKEEFIEKILLTGREAKIFTVSAGSIAIVDTSCIHRARPCTDGSRYALTSYY